MAIGLGFWLGRSDGTDLEHSVVLYSNQSSLNTTTLKFNVPAGNSLTVNWGDGNNEVVTCDGTLDTLTHDYAATGLYGIALEGDVDEIDDFRCDSQTWIQGNISGLSSLSGLEALRIHDTSISGDLAGVSGLTSLTHLQASNTSISGNVSNLSALTSLEYLAIDDTSAAGSISSFSGLTSMVTLIINDTALSGDISNLASLTSIETLTANSSSVSGDLTTLANFTSATAISVQSTSIGAYTTGALPAWAGCDIDISDLGLDSVEVDDFLNDLNDGDGAGGSVTIDGTNAAHSTASDTAITELEANSWTITRNDYIITSNQVSGYTTATVQVKVPATNTVTIRWGDGDTTSVVCDNVLNTYTHDYSANEKWGIDLTGDYTAMVDFRSNSQARTEGDIGNVSVLTGLLTVHVANTSVDGNVSGISSLSGLLYVNLAGTSVSGNISSFSGFTSASYLHLASTSVTGSVSSLTGLSSIENIYLYSTSVTGALSNLSGLTTLKVLNAHTGSLSGDIADLAPLTALTHLYLYNSSVDTYTGSTALPAWDSADIRIYDLGLSATEVDDFIIDLEDGGGNGDDGTLDISGTNATRTSASDTAKANLETDGWTVTANNP